MGGWIPSPCIRIRVWVGLSGWLHFISMRPPHNWMLFISLRLASWTGGRFPFALIRIMSVSQFLHHLQEAETKTHPKKVIQIGFASLKKIQYQWGFQNMYNPEDMVSGWDIFPAMPVQSCYALQLDSHMLRTKLFYETGYRGFLWWSSNMKYKIWKIFRLIHISVRNFTNTVLFEGLKTWKLLFTHTC